MDIIDIDYKTCKCCGKLLPACEFYTCGPKHKYLRYLCKTCYKQSHADENIRYKAKRKNEIADLKIHQGCSKCGYDGCASALSFHHIDPLEKSMSISDMVRRYSSDRLREQIDKCVVLCANCHAEFHERNRKFGIDIFEFLNDGT